MITKRKSVKTLKVNDKTVPKINLQGSLLEDCGFTPGTVIYIIYYRGRITITSDKYNIKTEKIVELYRIADIKEIWNNINKHYADNAKYNESLCAMFTQNLSQEQKTMFDKIINNIYRSKNCEYEAVFVQGYKTGANITLETLFS